MQGPLLIQKEVAASGPPEGANAFMTIFISLVKGPKGNMDPVSKKPQASTKGSLPPNVSYGHSSERVGGRDTM